MKVFISPEAHAEIMFHVHKADIEVSGLGRVEKTSTGAMVVTKIYLLKQESTGATTDIDQDEVAKLMYETREDKGNLNFWWHSHVNMDTFWSGTDMATIKQFGKNGYLLSTVFNKKGSHRTSYYQGNVNEFYPAVWVDDIETSFGYLPTQAMVDGWDKEHKEKCKVKKSWQPQSGAAGLGSGWCYPVDDDPSIPAEFNDPKYYTAGKANDKTYSKPTASNNAQLEYTGLTVLELVDELVEVYMPDTTYAFYSMYEQFLWWDFYGLVKGFEATDDEWVAKFVELCQDQEYFMNCMTLIGVSFDEEQDSQPQTNGNTPRQEPISLHAGSGSNTRGNKRGSKAPNNGSNKGKRTNKKGNDKGRKTTTKKN